MQQLNITFIGGGNMAEALFSGLLKAGHSASRITVSDVNTERLKFLHDTYHIHTTEQNEQAVQGADVIIFAVKPQQMADMLAALTLQLNEGMTLLSIAAGVEIKTMTAALRRDDLSIVRVMPNTPAMVGYGMSVLYSDSNETHQQRAIYVMGVCGETVWVEQESLLHAVTAISGSGPAYFFLLAELMQGAAESLKLPVDVAEKIVLQTALGAGMMLKKSGRKPAELRAQVTSPGGTTQAALDKMYEKDLPEAVRLGIVAASKRSKELTS